MMPASRWTGGALSLLWSVGARVIDRLASTCGRDGVPCAAFGRWVSRLRRGSRDVAELFGFLLERSATFVTTSLRRRLR